MRAPGETPANPWERILGFFIDNKLVVLILVGLLVFGGIVVSPFGWDLGPIERNPVPVDAIPDIGENQQIVFTEWRGRSPKDIEDQITYPLTTALLGIPKVRTVRSSSMFGFSTIYVIFDEDAGFYWSRSRLLEKLASLPPDLLPDDASPTLGPDATALGQVFWYTLEGRDEAGRVTGGWGLDELRSIQDWTVRYALQSVPGVSEVASVGGYVREYQVDVNPEALRAHDVTLAQVAKAVRDSNLEIGARTLEINRVEYVVRSRGFIEEVSDLEQAVITVRSHVPIRVRDVGTVKLGPAARRGALDDAGAEAVGGVVVARFGANPRAVIDAVKKKIDKIAAGLPRKTLDDGTTSQVRIVPFYDRTELIDETLDTLSTALAQQILITIMVVLIMLRHLRSSALISVMLPLAVLSTFLSMKGTGVDANVMSLAGIAIAIGTMVDMGIVLTENIVSRLAEAGPDEPRRLVIRRAAAEVGPAVLTSAATTIVSFLPVFALTASEGKLFRPLAFTKSFALGSALVLALAALPALAHVLLYRDADPTDPDDDWWRRLSRSVLRPVHLGDWVTGVLGLACAMWLSLPLGLFLIAVAALRLAQPLLPARWSRAPVIFEVVAAALGMLYMLTADWRPLGGQRTMFTNLVFVGGVVALVMATFLLFHRFYQPLLRWCLRNKGSFLLLPIAVILFGLTAWRGFGSVFGWMPESVRESGPIARLAHQLPGLQREFMPPFDEGAYLYMPTTMPHASFGQALDMLRQSDAAIASLPEIDRVVGKLGRAESPLDPAPISMFETVVTFKPEYGFDAHGRWVRNWRDHIRSPRDIWREVARAGKLPGLTNAPELMPIAARIVMLQTGMRAPVGLKVRGPDLESIERAALDIEAILKLIPSIRSETVVADRIVGKPYLEIDLDREAISRFGLTIDDVQKTIQIALGGMPLTRTVEGRERYPVRVRYMREERDSVEALRRVLVAAPSREQIPLGQLADIHYVRGPQVIKSEDTFKVGYVLFDLQPGVGEVDVVEDAEAVLRGAIERKELVLPDGVSYEFAGNYQNHVRSEARMMILLPIALAVVLLIIYLQFRQLTTVLIIFSGVTVSVAGGFALVWMYGQPGFLDVAPFGVDLRELFQVGTIKMSTAVWVGVIALIGISTDDGVVLATYLKQQFSASTPTTVEEIREHVRSAGGRRVRACLMTTATTVLALLPVITSHGKGADVMVPMAIPVLGGMFVELLTLFVVPVLYCFVEEVKLVRRSRAH